MNFHEYFCYMLSFRPRMTLITLIITDIFNFSDHET